MNKSDALAIQIHEWLVSCDIYQNYQSSLRALKHTPELEEMEKQLKILGKQIVKERQKPEGDFNESIIAYEHLKEQFMNHPVLVNYQHDLEEYEQLCLDIKAILEGQLD